VNLYIDIGNTRTKWALAADNGHLSPMQFCLNADIASAILPVDSVKKVVVSNVAGEGMAQHIRQLVAPLNPVWMQVRSKAAGVTNHYAPSLGTDRWAALVAAWHIHQTATLVVNAGTAITIDAIDHKGNFLGGSIMPGLHLMQKTLNSNTLQVNTHAPSSHAHLPDFATNTQDAVTTGAMRAATGAVMITLLQLQKHTGFAPKLLLSGGDADIMAQALNAHLKQVMMLETVVLHDLVLQGLQVLQQNDALA
jgi:type III pantothenate kinase